uniref:NADH-ubiquinone oxidoreductase chain 1 n=1 Tax=Phyllochaetopterus sp. AW-2015 TaxID=1750699 RepID=A0A0S2N0H1_9ANNE|nr:NADH dehydrogenase subunit 1 [Phyllochaetopterus sp. AW-2015]
MTSILLPYSISFILVILAMAFFTLLERKILGYAQLRKGPNKTNLAGLPQPLADALKLFQKERISPSQSNKTPYILAPMFSLLLALLTWLLYSPPSPTLYFSFGVFFFLALSSLNVYGTLISGWSSNSKYALLGALRAVAQTISYEVSMTLVILLPLIMATSLNLSHFASPQSFSPFILIILPFTSLWFITALAETNRTPFDFAEGESELVSGFNVEYSATSFAFIFMAEYINILFLSFLTAILFLGGAPTSGLLAIFLWTKTIFIAFLFLWTRATLPRMRYDLLMDLTWKSFLPTTLPILAFYISTHPLL